MSGNDVVRIPVLEYRRGTPVPVGRHLVAAGFLLIFTGKSDTVKQYGALIMGLGMIFFGMGIMSAGMKPLRTYQPFIELMQNVSNPAIGILIATAFTALAAATAGLTR